MVRKAVLWALIVVGAIVVGAIVLGLAVNFSPALAGDTPLGLHPYNLDVQHNGGFNASDTSQASLTFDGGKGNGLANLKVTEASKDRDNHGAFLICDDTLSVGSYIPSQKFAGLAGTYPPGNTAFAAESSVVIPCGQYKRFAMWIKVIPAAHGIYADTTTNIVLAVQVRRLLTAVDDSTSAAVWNGWATTGHDSTGTSLSGTDYAGQFGQGSYITPWPGEKLITFNPKQYAAGPLMLNAFGAYPNAQTFDLIDPRGMWFWGEYISVRIRCLKGYSADNNGASKPRVTAYLIMGS